MTTRTVTSIAALIFVALFLLVNLLYFCVVRFLLGVIIPHHDPFVLDAISVLIILALGWFRR